MTKRTTWPTPGNWRVKKTPKAEIIKKYDFIEAPKTELKKKGYPFYGMLKPVNDINCIRGRTRYEALANERLITSSPDLFYSALLVLIEFSRGKDIQLTKEQKKALNKLNGTVNMVVNIRWFDHFSKKDFKKYITNWWADAYAPTYPKGDVLIGYKSYETH